MSGFFGVVSKKDCVFDLFFGTDYHSHLGTKRGGLAVYSDGNYNRAIHNIENSPFRTKFERDVNEMNGASGIGCISDTEPQPLVIRSHLGSFAIATVGRINNAEDLMKKCFEDKPTHFLEMSSQRVNPTELIAVLINKKDSIPEGVKYAQSLIDGSMSMLILTPEGIYAVRDKLGRTPVILGKKRDAICASFESSAFVNLGYRKLKELGPGEIDFFNASEVKVVAEPGENMKICSFLWVYFGYPSSTYEGCNVEEMRYSCGKMLAKRDGVSADSVAGVPDSGIAHAIGYSNLSGIPFTRPLIKYTPTWPRSFMSQLQKERKLIAHMKLIPIDEMIKDKKLVLIDDSLVRGTQLKETVDFLYQAGAKELHVRLACPPIMYGCKYLNFSRSTSDMDLYARKVIERLEGDGNAKLELYSNPDTPEYANMVEEIRKDMNFTSLKYHRLDDMINSIGVSPCKLCTYCWNGKE